MKSAAFYFVLTIALLAASFFLKSLPAARQGAWLMAALFTVAVWFLIKICKG
jgi:hypothetical protein